MCAIFAQMAVGQVVSVRQSKILKMGEHQWGIEHEAAQAAESARSLGGVIMVRGRFRV